MDFEYRLERAWYKLAKGKDIDEINEDDDYMCDNEFLDSENVRW